MDDDDLKHDFDAAEFQQFICSSDATISDPHSQHHERTHQYLQARGNIKSNEMISASVQEGSLHVDATEAVQGDNCDHSSNDDDSDLDVDDEIDEPGRKFDYGSVIEFIANALQSSHETDTHDSEPYESNAENESTSVPTLSKIAKEFKLYRDEKQLAVYEIICSAFLLDVLNSGGSNKDIMAAAFQSSEDPVQKRKREVAESLRAKMATVMPSRASSNHDNIYEPESDQLLMYLTGPAGCGKSH